MLRRLIIAWVVAAAALSLAADEGLDYQLTGRVTDAATGEPIAGATIRVMTQRSFSGDPKLFRTGTSGADGRYTVAVPLGHAVCLVGSPPPGYFEAAPRPFAFATSAAEPSCTHDFSLHRGVACRVALAEATEKSDCFVTVFRQSPTLFAYSTRTDEHGAAGVTLPSDAGKTILSILSAGRRQVARVELDLAKGFDPARVKQLAAAEGDGPSTLTDAEGRTSRVVGARPVIQDGQLILHVKPAAADKLLRRVKLTGRIVDEHDQAVAEATIGFVHASASGASSATSFIVQRAADGTFDLTADVGTGTGKDAPGFMLAVTRRGLAGVLTSRKVISPGEETISVPTIKLGKGYSTKLRLVDDKDQPLVGAWVEAGEFYLSTFDFVKTDGQGRCEIRDLAAGVVPIRAQYGPLAYNGKLVIDSAAADQETTLRLTAVDKEPKPAVKFPDPPPVDSPAPPLAVVAWTDGKTRSLDDFRGKVVVLDFWGIWCSACMNSLPAMKQLKAKYADQDVVFLGIHSAGTEMSQVVALQRLKEWQLPTGIDQGTDVADGVTARAYGAHGWPTTVIIDRQGKIAFNSNLQKWNKATILLEQARLAKALELPPLKADATFEEQVARSNQMKLFRLSELIDAALARP